MNINSAYRDQVRLLVASLNAVVPTLRENFSEEELKPVKFHFEKGFDALSKLDETIKGRKSFVVMEHPLAICDVLLSASLIVSYYDNITKEEKANFGRLISSATFDLLSNSHENSIVDSLKEALNEVFGNDSN